MKRLEFSDAEFNALDDFVCRYVLSIKGIGPRVIEDEDPDLTKVFERIVTKHIVEAAK